MKSLSSHSKRILIGLTLFLFILCYSLVVKAGITDVRDLFGFIVASYLLVWGGYSLASSVSRDEIRVQFILMTISLGVALVLAEIPAWFKLIDYRKTFSTGVHLWEQPGYLPDPELLARPTSHHSVKILFDRGNIGQALCLPPHEAEPFELRYDKDGFRNDQDLTKADITVIGDSYIESQMMPTPMLATTRLAEITHKTVANLGQSGYGPQQELAVLKRFGLPLHPQTVVWVFYEGNDLLDAQEYTKIASLVRSKLNAMDMAWDRSFTKNVLFWLMRLVRGCVPEQKIPAVPATVLDSESKEHQLYVKGRSNSVSLTKQDLEALKNSVAAIEEAYRLVHKEGARLIVVFAPTAFRVYHDIASFEKGGGRTAPPWVLDDLPDRLRKMIAEISPDIGYLDLTPALKSAARNDSPVFLYDDTHWSTKGHQVVAEALAGVLPVESRMADRQPSEPGTTGQDIILSKDAIMIRNVDGTIRYWSKGAEKLYGWESEDALGMTSHQLLGTVFPVPLEAIEEELRRKGYWKGQLVHKRRDGSTVRVVSHWDLQQNPTSQDQSITVVEVNDRS
jgi:PAS domain S-box-containing protein